MKKALVSALAAGALMLGAASPAFATGKIYGNYGQGYAPQNYGAQNYGAPVYGQPVYGDPYRGGAPVYAYRERGDCSGDSVAGTIIGGVLGGVIGSNLARGGHHHYGYGYGWHGYRHSDRGPATVAGVLIGGLAGNAIANSACRDRAYGPAPYARVYGPRYVEPQYGYGEPAYYDEGYGPDDDYYDPDAPYDGR